MMTFEEAIKIGKTRQECLRAQKDSRCKYNLIPNYCNKGCKYNTSDKEYDEFETLVIKILEQQLDDNSKLKNDTPQKLGKWLRMSDLSEQEDDRYKCSCCGNVVHYKDKMDLYTFNSWCGRCGSDNRRQSEASK